jgi:hypothetical protein
MEDTRAVSGQAVTGRRGLGTRHRRRTRASGLLRGGSGGGQPARQPGQPLPDGESVTDWNAARRDADRGTDRRPAGAVGQPVTARTADHIDAHPGTDLSPDGTIGLPVTDRSTTHTDHSAYLVSKPGAAADGDTDPRELTAQPVGLADPHRVTLASDAEARLPRRRRAHPGSAERRGAGARVPHSATSTTMPVSMGQKASALFAPSTSEAENSVPFGLDARFWL